MKQETILELLKLALQNGENNINQSLPFKVGKQYFIRTVTHYHTGRVKEICGNFLILEDAAWIADTGRFSNAVKSGEFNEIEPLDDIILNITSIIDAMEITWKLPRNQK